MSEKSRYVVAAADEWLTAIAAITAADEARRRTVAQQDDLDAAEVALAAAVMKLAGCWPPDLIPQCRPT
jgi:hypothetical protein